jgi:hypothetical protein
MEIARHWRLRDHRLRLTGVRRELEDGTSQVSLTGSNWVEASHNGHKKNEDPMDSIIIYQAPATEEELAIPLAIHKEVEISAETG